MADNITIKDGNSNDEVLRAKDLGSSKLPAHYLLDQYGVPIPSIQAVDRTVNLDGQYGLVVQAIMNGRPADDKIVGLVLDGNTEGILSIDNEHHEIHEGDHYNLNDFVTLGNGSTRVFDGFTTTGNKHIHLVFTATGTDKFEVLITEDATLGTGGTAVTPRNNNRNYADASTFTLTQDPSGGADGAVTLINQSVGSTGAGGTGGNVIRDREIVLKANANYRFTITSRASGNTITYAFDWYEHTDRSM